MQEMSFIKIVTYCCGIVLIALGPAGSAALGQEGQNRSQGPPPASVRVTSVMQGMVSDQIVLIGTTAPDASSTVAAEVSGLVEVFAVQEGDFVEKGEMLAHLRSRDLELRLEAALAVRGKIQANLSFAEKELSRHTKLKDTNSIAARKYDEVFYEHKSLGEQLRQAEAEILLLKDDIRKKTVVAPFSGFVAKEHTQIGEWLSVGGPVVTLVDLRHIKISVDVPERYAVQLQPRGGVHVVVGTLSNEPFVANISAILPQGDPNARTLPVRVRVVNPEFKIKGAMEARVMFNLGTRKNALLVPKDAVVTAGTSHLVYIAASGVAQPVHVEILGYYDGNAAVDGALKPGDQVVIRGNERLRPGQPVEILSD